MPAHKLVGDGHDRRTIAAGQGINARKRIKEIDNDIGTAFPNDCS
jgi:hypothetical protein